MNKKITQFFHIIPIKIEITLRYSLNHNTTINKVYLMRGKRWKYVFLQDDVFEPLWNAEIIHYTNNVYSIRPYTKKYTPITINIPGDRAISLQDFTIIDTNGEIRPAVY